jgi:uracil-DNA glycosylase
MSRSAGTSSLGMTEAWNEYAYTIFVQGTVGFGARIRPSKEQWEDAKRHFRALIEEIRPTRVIVTGKDMWNRHMEGCDGPHLSDDLQAYRLKDGSLVWCLAVPHPSNTKQGFRWELVGESIRKFRSEKLPLRD